MFIITARKESGLPGFSRTMVHTLKRNTGYLEPGEREEPS